MSSGSSSYSYSDSSHFSVSDIDLVGIELNKRYGVIKRIGYGAFSTVWMAYDFVGAKLVAVKVLNEDDYQAGEEEIEVHKTLLLKNSSYINQMLDNFVYEKEHICIVYELFAGSVSDLLKMYQKGMSEKMVRDIIKQTLIALQDLNTAGYKHTDIKPENLLVVGQTKYMDDILHKVRSGSYKKNRVTILKELIKVPDDGTELDSKYLDSIRIKLTDFGTCRKLNHVTYDIQTRYYRCPDVILQYGCDKTCDLWSIGCMMYNLLTGDDLFDPPESDYVTCDRAHIYMMYSKLGVIPDHLINIALKKDVFFTRNNLLKGVRKIDYNEITVPLKDPSFLFLLLEYDPKKRHTIEQLLSNKWFQ